MLKGQMSTGSSSLTGEFKGTLELLVDNETIQ